MSKALLSRLILCILHAISDWSSF